MAVSRLLPSGGANDFNVAVGGTYTSVTFDKEYAPGAYTMTTALGDATYDIYVYNANGSLAGYTKSPSLTATLGFNKMVILGGTTSDLLSFSYKTTYTSVSDNDEVTAGPVFESCTPTALPDVNSTTTITGRNFASNATVTFTGTGYSATAAKAVVRNSPTSLTVTRPDNFPVSVGSYTITIENPGVTNPTGSNAHIGVNAVNGGTNPNWTTGTTLPTFTRNVAYSTTLVASDDGADVDYVITSGSLPTGLSLDGETGVISGTPTSATNVTFTVRAMDNGGNFSDRTFSMPNAAPTWTTAAGAITAPVRNFSYSFTVVATDDSGISPTYSLVSGALPAGLSLASNGVISGTVTANLGLYNFTIRATDANGNFTDRAFSQNITQNGNVVELVGASGGDATNGTFTGAGGNGARLRVQFIGSGTYFYYCGAGGSTRDASNPRGGAGGGGQTFFGTGSSDPSSGSPLYVAGGGGGCAGQDTFNECSGNPFVGGAGGASIVYSGGRAGGAGGGGWNGGGGGSPGGASGGTGGTAGGDNSGGGGGGGWGSGAGGSQNQGMPGGAGGGGGGGAGGSGGTCYRGSPGGGGGGGYIGGNGGTPGSTSAGGGTSYAVNSSDVTLHTPGFNDGNGYIIINGTTYTGSGSVSL